MSVLKTFIASIFLLCSVVFFISCDNSDEYVEDKEYKGAFEELDEYGNIHRERRLDVVKEIIKTNEDDPRRMEVDRDMLGID